MLFGRNFSHVAFRILGTWCQVTPERSSCPGYHWMHEFHWWHFRQEVILLTQRSNVNRRSYQCEKPVERLKRRLASPFCPCCGAVLGWQASEWSDHWLIPVGPQLPGCSRSYWLKSTCWLGSSQAGWEQRVQALASESHRSSPSSGAPAQISFTLNR